MMSSFQGYTLVPHTVASFLIIATSSIFHYRNTGVTNAWEQGLVSEVIDQKLEAMRALGGYRSKSQQHTNLSETTTAKRLCFHFIFISCFSICQWHVAYCVPTSILQKLLHSLTVAQDAEKCLGHIKISDFDDKKRNSFSIFNCHNTGP